MIELFLIIRNKKKKKKTLISYMNRKFLCHNLSNNIYLAISTSGPSDL